RLLGHIHDADVQKLAHPGLVLRVITTEIIAEVLAGPCAIDVRVEGRKEALFEALAREALVTREGDELHHRTDVRRVMLDLLRADPTKEKDVKAIHRAAVAYHEKHASPRDRAEEIYHRLCLCEPTDAVDARWIDGLKPYFSRAAVDEIP